MSHRVCLIVFLFALVPSTFSCGYRPPPRPADMPALVACSVVVLDESDTPVAGAQVVLIPRADSRWGASGVSDVAGKTQFKTEGLYAGVVPGEYKVLVSKKKFEPTGVMSQDTGDEIMKEISLIDPTFGRSGETPLSLTVPADGTDGTVRVKTAPK